MNAWKVFAVVLISSLSLVGQNEMGTFRGNVVDAETGEPIPFATIQLVPSGVGTLTDIEGFFSVRISPGNYTANFKFLGYDSISVNIELKASQVKYQQIAMSAVAYNLNTVEVSARKAIRKSETNLASVKINPTEIIKIPGLSVQGDIAQYLNVLPGVLSSGEQGGQIYISGGSPHQNLTILDGIVLINPFHSLSGFSVFPSDMILSADLKGAAYPAQYGGRISSVLDIKYKNSLAKNWSGSMGVDPFVGQAYIEGPIWSSKSVEGLGIGLMVGGKQSLIDRTAESIYSHIDNGIPFTFRDLNAKLIVSTPNGNYFSVTGLRAEDEINLAEADRFEWNMEGLGFNFRLLPPRSSIVMNGQLSLSNFSSSLNSVAPRNSLFSHFRARIQMQYFGVRDQVLTYGFQLEGAQTDFSFLNFANITFNQKDNTSDIAGFINHKAIWKKLIADIGLRVIYYASVGNFSVEPRMAAKYLVTDDLRLKFGVGRYSQNFILARKDQDVVNFFNAFLSSPDGQLPKLDGSIANTNLQKSDHALVGLEVDMVNGLSIDAELYLKRFNQLIELNRNKVDEDDLDWSIENGTSLGINTSMVYTRKNWNAYLNYSWLKATRENGEQTYPAHFDRRHQLTAWLNYDIQDKWNFSLRWTLGSGFPFTRTQGFFDRILFEDGIQEDLITTNGELGVIYEFELNQGRLPYYHRLDASASRIWSLRDKIKIQLGASLINLYDRDNIFYFDRITYNRVDQFPFIPSIGLKVSF